MSTERIDWEAAKRHLHEAETALERALVADPARIQQVYRDRAVQMAKRHAETTAEARTTRVLVFSLGAETYGIAIAELAEVLPAVSCTPVPRAPAEIVGVINLRGELRSVIDLRRVLALAAEGNEPAGRILMLRHGHEEVGLKVGRVEKVQSIREDELASPEAGRTDQATSYFKGLSPDKVIVLDTAVLLAHPVFGTSARSLRLSHPPAMHPSQGLL